MTSLDKVEVGLADARISIWEATLSRNYNTSGKPQYFVPKLSIYKNPYAFLPVKLQRFLSNFIFFTHDKI
ncbi:putative glycosyltransferase [Sesbania bispinosa]|nr:putative glycosyltransferase [Sesbania bispinosa]